MMNVYKTLMYLYINIILTYFKFYWDINISQDITMSAVSNPWKRLGFFVVRKFWCSVPWSTLQK